MKEHLKRKQPANSPFSAEDGYKQRKLDAFAKNDPAPVKGPVQSANGLQ